MVVASGRTSVNVPEMYSGCSPQEVTVHCHIWTNRSSTKVCPVVEVGLQLRGYPAMMLSVYVVPTICEPLVSQPIAACVKQHPHLMRLELADCSSTDSSMPIDMLIGSDYYWELVTGSI